MSHFAEINNENVVLRVIVAEQDFINSGAVGDASHWVQTSYNTSGGAHRNGGTPLRKNYAGIGFTYDSVRDAFIPPSPFASWVLNEDTCQWNAPVAMPTNLAENERAEWNETNGTWDIVTR